MKRPVASAPAARSLKDLHTGDDLMREFHLLPDDSDMDAAQMQIALASDLAPRTPIEKLIVRDLVDLELERTRSRRWIQMTIMTEVFEPMLAQAEAGGQKGKLTVKDGDTYRQRWRSAEVAERHRIVRALSDFGIDPTPYVLEARIKQGELIDAFEERVRDIAHRRRRLYEDLMRVQSRARSAIAEAQTVDRA